MALNRKRRCVRCGEPFEFTRSTKRYCTTLCRNAVASGRHKAKERALPIVRMRFADMQTCPICGEAFLAPRRAAGDPQAYCTKQCKRIAVKLRDLSDA